jgi:hypothetical protein
MDMFFWHTYQTNGTISSGVISESIKEERESKKSLETWIFKFGTYVMKKRKSAMASKESEIARANVSIPRFVLDVPASVESNIWILCQGIVAIRNSGIMCTQRDKRMSSCNLIKCCFKTLVKKCGWNPAKFAVI